MVLAVVTGGDVVDKVVELGAIAVEVEDNFVASFSFAGIATTGVIELPPTGGAVVPAPLPAVPAPALVINDEPATTTCLFIFFNFLSWASTIRNSALNSSSSRSSSFVRFHKISNWRRRILSAVRLNKCFD